MYQVMEAALIRKRVHFEQYILILLINFKAQNRKIKTNTNPNPDPNRYRRRCPDPNARIQKTEDLQIKTENTKLRLRKI